MIEANKCQVLFISSSQRSLLSKLDDVLPLNGILTISESFGFTAHGGIIRLFVQDEKVRFIINEQTAEKAGLKISSQLLKLSQNK